MGPIDKMANQIRERIYKQGYIDGLKSHAYWKDGVQYVGNCGRKLKEAIEDIEDNYNYDPPKK